MKQPKQCEFPGCEEEAYARGLCRGHYQQHNRGHAARPLRQEGERLKKDALAELNLVLTRKAREKAMRPADFIDQVRRAVEAL